MMRQRSPDMPMAELNTGVGCLSRFVRRAACGRLAGLLALGLAVGLSGCATDPLSGQRIAAYVPSVAAEDRMPWAASVERDAAAGAPSQAPGVTAVGEADRAVSTSAGLGRQLRRGERLTISLRGIPRPEDVSAVLDDDGHINLPLIGLVKIEGLSNTEAEQAIQRAYIDGGYYRDVNVIIVAQDDVVFVRGEVTRPGKYPLVGDTTLLMAIAAAGGYTDYANPRKIRVIRGDDVYTPNATRIEARQEEDLLLHPNDIVIVERRIFL